MRRRAVLSAGGGSRASTASTPVNSARSRDGSHSEQKAVAGWAALGHTTGLMDVELVAVEEADKPVLMNLVQFYQYDFSEIRDLALTRHGTFIYRYLDPYFTEADREPYFITVDGQLTGFTLARGDVHDGSWNIAEFFVARRYRRQGVARESARRLFARHPGVWTLSSTTTTSPQRRCGGPSSARSLRGQSPKSIGIRPKHPLPAHSSGSVWPTRPEQPSLTSTPRPH